MSFGDKKDAKKLFQKIFCNALVEKALIKHLINIDFLH